MTNTPQGGAFVDETGITAALVSADPIFGPQPRCGREPRASLRSSPVLRPVRNGSAQLSYFIYSCTASNPTPSPHNSKRRRARVNLRPSVLCIRSTMSNSQRTVIREQMSDTRSPTELSNSSFSRGHSNQSILTSVLWKLVEPNGIEPMTSCLQSRRSPS